MGNQLGDPEIIAEMQASADRGDPMLNKADGNKVRVFIVFAGGSYYLLSTFFKIITPSKQLRFGPNFDKENAASSSGRPKKPRRTHSFLFTKSDIDTNESSLIQELHDQHIFQEKISELASQSLEELRVIRRELTSSLMQALRYRRVLQEKTIELASQNLEELRAMRRELTSLPKGHHT
jgi:hypothetical protein